jgi:hypothetical protein
MKKASMIFWILLFILPFNSSCFSQQKIPKGVFVNTKGEGNFYWDSSIIDDTNNAGDWYYFRKLLNGLGREATECIVNSLITQKSWPSAINSKKKREQRGTNEMLLGYTMYVVIKFPEYKNSKDTYTYLLYLPEAENRHMPSGYRLKKDLFLLANYKCVQIDSSQSTTFILPQAPRQVKEYKFWQMPNIVYWMDDDSISEYSPIYTNQLGEKVFQPKYELEGLYGYNIQGLDGHKRYVGESFAGTNLKIAEENYYQIKWRVEEYLQKSNENSAFKMVPNDDQGKKNMLQLVNTGYNPNYGLQATLQLVDNSDQAFGVPGQKGYTCRFELQRYVDPTDAFWQQLAHDNSMNGTENFQKQTRSGVLREDIEIKRLKEVGWELFSEDSARISTIRPNKDFKMEPPRHYKNIWITTGRAYIGRGNYQFFSASPGDSTKTGRSLLVYGFRDTEESLRRAAKEDSSFREWEAAEQKIRYSSPEEYYRKLSWAEDTLRSIMKGVGYSSINKLEFKGPGDFRIPVYQGEHLSMASISFSKNSKLQLCQTDHTNVEYSNESRLNGVYINDLEIKSSSTGTFLGDVYFQGTGGDKDQTTIVLYSTHSFETEKEEDVEDSDADKAQAVEHTVEAVKEEDDEWDLQ